MSLINGECPVAAPFKDGVWWDEREGVFNMWYHTGWMRGTAYVHSVDGTDFIGTEASREPFIASERMDGEWDKAYIHAAGGVCLVVAMKCTFTIVPDLEILRI